MGFSKEGGDDLDDAREIGHVGKVEFAFERDEPGVRQPARELPDSPYYFLSAFQPRTQIPSDSSGVAAAV